MNNHKRIMIGIVALAIVAVSSITAIFLFKHNERSNKNAVLSKSALRTEFPLYELKDSSDYVFDKSTEKYDPVSELYSIIAKKDDVTITVSIQSTPEGFVDVPQAYDKLIEKLRGFGAFETKNGKVFLTRPVELEGGETAVMNAKGVLLFAKPDRVLDINTWKVFFNDLYMP